MAEFGPGALRAQLESLLPGTRAKLCLAFSGGLDSTVLLHALHALRLPRGHLRALHIDHRLQPASPRWARHCAAAAARLGIDLEVRRAKVARIPGASPEALARAERYRLLAAALAPGEVLLTAQHADDQLETVLLQLIRGSGLPGLAGMPACAPFGAGLIARPLLPWSRAQLESWGRAAGLEWIEDATNVDMRFERNWLRATVLPLLRARHPGLAGSIARSAAHAAEAQQLLAGLAARDLEEVAAGRALDAARLRRLAPARRANLLRAWIAAAGIAPPQTRRLREIAGPLLEAREDAHPEVRWPGGAVRRRAGRLWLEADTAEQAGMALRAGARRAPAASGRPSRARRRGARVLT